MKPAWLLVLAPLAAAAAGPAPAAVRDLAWGEVLFEHFQDESFEALVRVEAAQARGELPHHADDAELLKAGTYLAWGLRERAAALFAALLERGTTPDRHDRAWYWLARIHHERDEQSAAASALARIGDALPPTLAADRTDLAGRVLIALGENEAAAGVLADADQPGAWQGFAAFNRAVALVRAGRRTEGLAALDALGAAPAERTELKLLGDRANLALGLARLEDGDPAGARAALDRVRLDGPYSARALLAAGWAEAAQARYREALGPWTRLASLRSPDGASLEALLAVPWAWYQLGESGESVAGYELATSALESELARLDAARATLDRGRLAGFLAGRGADDALAVYLHALAADHPFRAAVADLADLDALEANLLRWRGSLGAFDDMVAARRARFESVAPAVRAALEDDRGAALASRVAALDARVRALESVPDPAALASPREAAQLRRVHALRGRALALPLGERRDAALARLSTLEGILTWQLHVAWPARLRALDKVRAGAARELAAHRAQRASLARSLAGGPAGFEGFETRIEAAALRVETLLARARGARGRRLGELTTLAAEELDLRRQRVDAWLGQARFAYAAAYDGALQQAAAPAGGELRPEVLP